MSDYSEEPVSEPQAKQPVATPEKPKREAKKLSDKQKADLTKHMEKMKKDGMSASEMKSHRMKLMSRMRKDPKMTAKKAHKDVMSK
jgi:DNA-binding protein H-NS